MIINRTCPGKMSTIALWLFMLALVSLFLTSNLFAEEQTSGSPAQAKEGPPLPLHTVEGSGGVFSTFTAYLVNPAKPGHIFGYPSVGGVFVHVGNGRALTAFTLTETLWDRIELGYAIDNLDLGDLSQDVEHATGIKISEDAVNMHNFNARVLMVKEGDFGQSWLPAITAGVHFKYNQQIDDIDDDLMGTLDGIGVKDNHGVDFTLYATKMLKFLPRPVLVSAGARSTKAAHLGLLGFTDERKLVFEGNIVAFLTDQFALGAEYRQKPHEYDAIPGLIAEEDNWWTLCACYIVNNHMTLSGGYGHFGDVLNHEANGAWGLKIKWEF